MSTLRVEALEQPDGTAFVFNNKNLLINGGMNVWQRQTSVTGKTTGAYYTADRWQTSITTAGTWTQERSTDVPTGQGFGYSLKMDCTTADASLGASDVLAINQRIEGQNLQRLLKGTSSSKAVTLSFWVKSNKTGTYIAELVDNDNTRQISKSYTISSANTWEKKEITYDGDTTGTLDNDSNQSMRVIFWLAAGSNFTSGTLNTSWASTTNANRVVGQVNLADSTSNEWYMTGCQLEVGSTASGFEFEPYETVLRKCERYYEHSFHEGQFEGAVTSAHCWHTNSFSSGDDNCPGPLFRVVKRDTPTVRLYSSSSNTAGQVSSGGTARAATAANITTRYVSYISVTSGTGLTYTRYNYAVDCEI